ncbi:hypothetical protein [Algoriphagus aquimarinus]|mgnify:CR=1 FL=1|uniref:hypothetical protein n=1 Tax=Algoriphagus aquimarinus TaxID=237018 RepID=UPI0030DD41FB|tara:strand:- start:47679 stop:49289 length:1611 start_codon:yes stop_codon:yes gene_type:complete
MIVAIERSNFINLFKFGVHIIGFNNVFDLELEELSKLLLEKDSLDILSLKFDEILPMYEQDHEVLILEVDKSKIGFNKGIEISFNSIKKIFPLTKMGQNLLFGKLNSNIRVENPIFEEVIGNAKILREVKIREFTVDKLFKIFKVPVLIAEEFRKEVKDAFITFSKHAGATNSSFIYHLLTFNKNFEWFVKGNSEYLQKIACITALSAGKTADSIRTGLFVSSIKKNSIKINYGNSLNGYLSFIDFLKKSEEFDAAYKGLNSKINPTFNQVDLFKVSYFYFAIKTYLESNDQNLTAISQMIYDQLQMDAQTFSHVIYLIAFTFSHDQLYKSLYELENTPVLLNTVVIRFSSNQKESKPILPDLEIDLPVGANVNWEKSSSTNEKVTESQKGSHIPDGKNSFETDKTLTPIKADENSMAGEAEEAVNEPKNKYDTKENVNLGLSADTDKESKSTESGYFSVRDFRKWLKDSIPSSSKVKNWELFVQNYFSVDDENITEERLLDAISRPDVKKSDLFITKGKNKFDFNLIKSGFFKKK